MYISMHKTEWGLHYHLYYQILECNQTDKTNFTFTQIQRLFCYKAKKKNDGLYFSFKQENFV